MEAAVPESPRERRNAARQDGSWRSGEDGGRTEWHASSRAAGAGEEFVGGRRREGNRGKMSVLDRGRDVMDVEIRVGAPICKSFDGGAVSGLMRKPGMVA